jgi:hypothetical protein
MVNTIRRWSEGFNPDSEPGSQCNRSMVSWEINRWRREKEAINVRQKESNNGGGSVHDWRKSLRPSKT